MFLPLSARRPVIPKKYLTLDLDLEADLGIDTVKQAELFAAIRSAIWHRPPRGLAAFGL